MGAKPYCEVQYPSKHGCYVALSFINFALNNKHSEARGITKIFFLGGGQQIQLRTEGRENGDLRAVVP
jgi:hypothetical protein